MVFYYNNNKLLAFAAWNRFEPGFKLWTKFVSVNINVLNINILAKLCNDHERFTSQYPINMCKYGLSLILSRLFCDNISALKGINFKLIEGKLRNIIFISLFSELRTLCTFFSGRNSSKFCLKIGQQSDISSS